MCGARDVAGCGAILAQFVVGRARDRPDDLCGNGRNSSDSGGAGQPGTGAADSRDGPGRDVAKRVGWSVLLRPGRIVMMTACKLSSRRRVATTACAGSPAPGISRVMADEVVGHAFSHGFHPQHVERL